MTHTTTTTRQKAGIPGVGTAVFGSFALFCLLLILHSPDVAIEYVTRGLRLCATTVIPSLFPFMVLSEIIVSAGIARRMPRPLLAPLRRLLGLSDVGCSTVLLGALCGFPVGARCAVLAMERGEMSRAETERVLTCSNNPSSAFLISAVGVSLFENRGFGVALYATVLLSSLLSAILFRLRCGSVETPVTFPVTRPNDPPIGARLFTDAIASAIKSILLVSSYVVFFSALMGALHLVLGGLGLTETLSAFLFCLLELSGGVSRASALGNTAHAALLCAFATGWSGLSVHCQILSVCNKKALSLRPYFFAKLLQGILCLLLFGILIRLFPSLLIPAQSC